MHFRFSRLAEADVESIGAYIARDNPIRAISFVSELRQRCRELVHFPGSCPLHPELGDGLRMTVFGSYLIFYVVDEDILEVRRVLHHARNTKEAFHKQ